MVSYGMEGAGGKQAPGCLDMNVPSLVPEPDPQLQVLQPGPLEPIPGMGICTPSAAQGSYLVSLLCPQMMRDNRGPQPSPSALSKSPALGPARDSPVLPPF